MDEREAGYKENGVGARNASRFEPQVRFFFRFLFYILSSNLMIITGNELEDREDSHEETGPNDARRVVWALGKFFFRYIYIFFTAV